MVRWLKERGLDAQGFKTEYGDDDVADQASLSVADTPQTLPGELPSPVANPP